MQSKCMEVRRDFKATFMENGITKFSFGEVVVNKLKIKLIWGHVLLNTESFQQKLLWFHFLFRNANIMTWYRWDWERKVRSKPNQFQGSCNNLSENGRTSAWGLVMKKENKSWLWERQFRADFMHCTCRWVQLDGEMGLQAFDLRILQSEIRSWVKRRS